MEHPEIMTQGETKVTPLQLCRLVQPLGGRSDDCQGYKLLVSFFPKHLSFFGPPHALQALIDLANIDGRHEPVKILTTGSLAEASLGDVSARFVSQPCEQGKSVKTDPHDVPHPHGQPHALATLLSQPNAHASVAKAVRALMTLA